MNDKRRKAIREITKSLSDIRAEIDALGEKLNIIKDEEEEYMDNIPENLQSSERYEATEEACSGLEDAYDNIISATELLDEVTEDLMGVI